MTSPEPVSLSGAVLRDRGDYVAALRWLRLARRTARRSSLVPLEVEAVAEHGRIRLLEGRHRAATVALRQAQRLLGAASGPAASAPVYLLEGEMHVQHGQLAAAQRAAAMALQSAREAEALWVHRATSEFGNLARVHQGLAQRLLGVCALRLGIHPEAQAHLRAALTLQLEQGATLEAARTRLQLAAALVSAEGMGIVLEEARTLLAAAQAQFTTSAAGPDLIQAGHLAAAWSVGSSPGQYSDATPGSILGNA